VQRYSEAAIVVVEADDQRDGPVVAETDDVVVADDEVAVDVSYCWMEGEAGCWIEEEAY
jgi:hypothetical protein